MFVFKAAVVGAGTMGGQIAQTIAAAGIPVVMKDVRQELVDHGLTEARNVTAGQVAGLVEKGKLTEEQAAAQVESVLALIEGTTTYEGFGDVDFVIEAVPERMEIKQAVFAELDACTPGHAILASNTSSLSITEIGEATLRPEKVVGFHYFYPASVMPLIEVIEGDDTSPETLGAAVTFAQTIKKQPITLRRGPRLRRQPHPQLGDRRGLARAGGAGPVDQADRRGHRRRERHADGPVLPHQPARPGHRAARRRAPQRLLRRPLLRAQGHAAPRRRRQARRQDRRRRLLLARGRAEHRGRRRAGRRRARQAADAEDVRRGLPRARGGRRHPPRHRLRDDGRRRAGPAPRDPAAVHARRRRGARHAPRAARGAPRSATASASPRRRSCAAWSPRAAWARRAARASTPTRSPTPSSPPARRRSSSSRRAATSRSRGSPTGR